MKIGHLNVRSLIPHFNDFSAVVTGYDILAVGETWLMANVDDSAVQIKDYSFLHRDRESRGGGVGVYIKNTFRYDVLDSSNAVEQLWLNVKYGRVNFILGVVYRPPEAAYGQFLEELEVSFSNCLPLSEFIICVGDINIDLLKKDSAPARSFNETLETLGFLQIVAEPTRISATGASLIDLIIISDDSFVHRVGVRSVHISDHELIECEIFGDCTAAPKLITYRDYKDFDLELFQQHLSSLNLDIIFYISDIDLKVEVCGVV